MTGQINPMQAVDLNFAVYFTIAADRNELAERMTDILGAVGIRGPAAAEWLRLATQARLRALDHQQKTITSLSDGLSDVIGMMGPGEALPDLLLRQGIADDEPYMLTAEQQQHQIDRERQQAERDRYDDELYATARHVLRSLGQVRLLQTARRVAALAPDASLDDMLTVYGDLEAEPVYRAIADELDELSQAINELKGGRT